MPAEFDVRVWLCRWATEVSVTRSPRDHSAAVVGYDSPNGSTCSRSLRPSSLAARGHQQADYAIDK